MLSKLFARGLTSRAMIVSRPMMQIPIREFRSDFVNPYIESAVKVTD